MFDVVIIDFATFSGNFNCAIILTGFNFVNKIHALHCVKNVQIRSFFWSVFSRIHVSMNSSANLRYYFRLFLYMLRFSTLSMFAKYLTITSSLEITTLVAWFFWHVFTNSSVSLVGIVSTIFYWFCFMGIVPAASYFNFFAEFCHRWLFHVFYILPLPEITKLAPFLRSAPKESVKFQKKKKALTTCKCYLQQFISMTVKIFLNSFMTEVVII